ncbi:hypothetical protein [uncultured Nostoc sp.]|uniref:hypothetical protein n=1 Tax=uncultured Nostoc sp. TaxID=340711 RepID=UPI0035CCA832
METGINGWTFLLLRGFIVSKQRLCQAFVAKVVHRSLDDLDLLQSQPFWLIAR